MTIYHPTPCCQIPSLAEFYDETFGAKTNGLFVEVGAYDGRTVSNTAFLADLGWRGLYIEPVPEYAAVCAANHGKRVKVLNAAIGATDGEVDIYVGDVFSTGLRSQRDLYAGLEWSQKSHATECKITVGQFRLDTVLGATDIKPGFELLVVDVEGMEDQVFAGFDLAKWLPKMVIVELEDFHPDFKNIPKVVERCTGIRRLMADNGYDERFCDHINTVFVR